MPIRQIDQSFAIIKLSLEPSEIVGLLKKHTPDRDYKLINDIEACGKKLVKDNFPGKDARDFVTAVCKWGRGHRILTRVLHQNKNSEFSAKLRSGYKIAKTNSVSKGVMEISCLKGLGISYASKILRCLMPKDAVIMDSVIRERLGYRESRVGYDEFLSDCSILFDYLSQSNIPKIKRRPKLRICDVEAAIFQKLKQT